MKTISFRRNVNKVLLYAFLALVVLVTILPFIWMISASIKSDREVFQLTPFVLAPENPRWSNYVKIWTKIPFAVFIRNTIVLTAAVTYP